MGQVVKTRLVYWFDRLVSLIGRTLPESLCVYWTYPGYV